jgi:isoleucyl-tRNA synthetase
MSQKPELKNTINLPKTDFGMKANLSELEPRLLARWEAEDLYRKVRDARIGAPVYTLHDGPPYASGELHIGTGMNKILKDIVVKYKTMRGFDAPFIPGWDCHGLPIEQKVLDEMQKAKAEWQKPEIRERSRDFALKHIEGHRRQFKALGILGRWQDPYLTLTPKYEAAVIDLFSRMVEKGYVYRKRKPVHWSSVHQTALAEAELEYKERKDPSVTLRFPLKEGEAGLLVWTTTPWTLFGNVAVAVHPDHAYALVEYARAGRREKSWVARARMDAVLAKIGASEPAVVEEKRGAALVGLLYERPFEAPAIERAASVVTAPYVSMEDGTGLVHTAPGHGREDYETSLEFGLPVLSPVDARGLFTSEVPQAFRGLFVLKANEKIVEHLAAKGVLLHHESFLHSYPHDWRAGQPTIFRATEQWFVAVDHEGLRERAISTVREKVRWFPDYGLSRIEGMLRERPDWCLSRQRAWGIPIPAFEVEETGETILGKETCDRVRDLFRQEGADAWFKRSPEEILGPALIEKLGLAGKRLKKGEDIFDVWFESGSSWHAVIDEEKELRFPADLYLEGSDQHRGWFQLSLIPALAATGGAPFRAVDTHGFVVDEKGEKMSKSKGNYLSLEDGLKRFSADILRLWFSSVDYWEDVKVSVGLIEKMRDTYRRIRNTFKYLLGNLHDWADEGGEEGAPAEPDAIDRWIRARMEEVRAEVEEAYEGLRFHKVYRAIHDFCAVELSTVYFEAVRDRLYCELPDDPRRRATQETLGQVLYTLVRLLAPILVFTCEEVWDHMKAASWGKGWLVDSVHLALWPRKDEEADPGAIEAMRPMLALRDEVYRSLEPLRKEKTIGEPTDAWVDLALDAEGKARVLSFGVERLAELLVVAGVTLADLPPGEKGVKVSARRSPFEKCERCWVRRADVAPRPEHGGALLSARDARVLSAIAAKASAV